MYAQHLTLFLSSFFTDGARSVFYIGVARRRERGRGRERERERERDRECPSY
jgi:hypothetical protein